MNDKAGRDILTNRRTRQRWKLRLRQRDKGRIRQANEQTDRTIVKQREADKEKKRYELNSNQSR